MSCLEKLGEMVSEGKVVRHTREAVMWLHLSECPCSQQPHPHPSPQSKASMRPRRCLPWVCTSPQVSEPVASAQMTQGCLNLHGPLLWSIRPRMDYVAGGVPLLSLVEWQRGSVYRWSLKESRVSTCGHQALSRAAGGVGVGREDRSQAMPRGWRT